MEFSRCARIASAQPENAGCHARRAGLSKLSSEDSLDEVDVDLGEPAYRTTEVIKRGRQPPEYKSSGIPRKEVIQPQLPLRLPCYDFTPIIDPTFDGSLPKG